MSQFQLASQRIMNLRRRTFPNIILVATLIWNFTTFVHSNVSILFTFRGNLILFSKH